MNNGVNGAAKTLELVTKPDFAEAIQRVEAWYHHADLPLVSEVARCAHLGEALPDDRRFGPRE